MQTVPTEDMRDGDFSALLALGPEYPIYDPATTRPSPTEPGRFIRDPFPGNIIPPDRLDPAAQAILEFWPLPNQPGTADGRDNYSNPTLLFEETYYTATTRVDHQVSNGHRLYGRFSWDFWEEAGNDWFSNPATGTIMNRKNRVLALDDAYTIRPNLLLNVRGGFTRQLFPERRQSEGFDLASLGVDPELWERNFTNLMPRVGLSWLATPTTAVRGGYGLFYDMLGTNRLTVNQAGFSRDTAITPSLDNGQTFIATLADPLPDGLLAPEGSGLGLMTDVGLDVSVPFIGDVQNPRSHRWSLGIQQELPGEILVEATYVGAYNEHLPVTRELNPVPPEYLSTSPVRDQGRVERRLVQGLTLQLGYTWSRAMDETAQPHEFLQSQHVSDELGVRDDHAAEPLSAAGSARRTTQLLAVVGTPRRGVRFSRSQGFRGRVVSAT